MQKRFLVTGSNGFIGAHLCRYLKERGYYVIGLGRRAAAANTYADEYICCDLATPDAPARLRSIRADGVAHLAADLRHAPYDTAVVQNNCTGTQCLIEFCQEKRIQAFVQLSSLPLIGTPTVHPITEDHPIGMFPTVYHATKRFQELLAEYAWNTYGLRTVSFRISAPVGPGMNPKTIFPTFIRNACTGSELTVFGTGTRKQTYVHVDDISQAILKALESQTAHGIYNLAGNAFLSNYELAKRCVKLLQSDSRIVFSGQNDPQDDVVWDVSLEKIEAELDYRPAVSLDSAILEMANTMMPFRSSSGGK